MIREEKYTVHCQGRYFWGDAQFIGYGRLKKMVQVKYMLNGKQSLFCWRWCHVPLLFIHQFLRFVLLLLLHHSVKITIPHDHMFLLLQIIHLLLFKLMQSQGELIISGDSRVFFWWARDGNRAYHFWGELIYYFFGTVLLRYIFWPSVSKSCPPRAATMQQWLRRYWWKAETRVGPAKGNWQVRLYSARLITGTYRLQVRFWITGNKG